MKRQHSYLVFTIMLFFVLLVPSLIQDGMFFDGVTYSAIAKNLANGIGSFYKPHYTKTLYPEFYEHPPLAFILQSFFFKIFGIAFYTERIYSFLTALFTAIGIAKIWILCANKPEIRSYYWLPVLLWLSVPIISWSYRNNMLENTMGLFTVFAVFFILKALIKGHVIDILISSIFIIYAFLSKGPVGLFPLIVPLIYAFVFNHVRKPYILLFLLIITVSMCAFILFMVFPDLKYNIQSYLDQQVVPAIRNEREITSGHRFQIIFDLVLELIIPLVLTIAFLYQSWRKKELSFQNRNQKFQLFIFIAVSASLPLIVSLKQSIFYLVPSIPFYALAFSFLLADYVKARLDTISGKIIIWLNLLSITLLVIVLIFSFLNFGRISRDKNKLNDVYILSNHFPEGTILSSNRTLWSDWSLVAYLSRVGYISFDCDKYHDYHLVEKGTEKELPLNYKPIELRLKKYTVLKRQDN